MQKTDIKDLQAASYLSDGNIAYIEQLYDSYIQNPDEVPENWREYFDDIRRVNGTVINDVPLSEVRDYFLEQAKKSATAPRSYSMTAEPIDLHERVLLERKQAKVNLLINAYRTRGYLLTKLDPLGLSEIQPVPVLELNYYGLSKGDLDTYFNTGDLAGPTEATLGSIYAMLQKTYCGSVGIEYMHISNEDEIAWLKQRFESVQAHPKFLPEQKIRILKQLIAADGLEKYLGTKYVGQKRFSLEGGTTLIPMMDELVLQAGSQGVKEILIGMAHRGRLNVLVNVFGKSPESLFREFEGKKTPDLTHSGDVKYHMGFSSNVKTPNGLVHLALAFNPSHLEIIDPVIEGSVRARQDRRVDINRTEVIPLLIHGDSAFIGQGVVAETFNMSETRGFTTGGTVHIVVNNQVGFTTSDPRDIRSSRYCTDIAKMLEIPILHVNGDDPEACVFATQVAFDYRMQFKKDVVIDLVCYRRHGHNEADEPAMTQPLMYKTIKQRPYTYELYRDNLVAQGLITIETVDKFVQEYRDLLDQGKSVIEVGAKDQVKFLANWKPYKDQDWETIVKTGVSMKTLHHLGNLLSTVPKGITVHPQLEREYEARRKMTDGELALNWGFAETLAYATLLTEGYPVRLCGQDSGRGTFAHRHSVLHDFNDGHEYIPLQHLAADQAPCWIIDSVLSEESVLGYEYGYATTDPETLVIWEAQFGDFANGAQVVIDQFISSGEQKWGRLCGLTMLLPHGYEGQGPEHTSARLERYLQLCAQKNIQVCMPTTPAQFFHMMRRQMLRPYRKPLIVMTPKSLLRHKLAVSSLEDLANGAFQPVIPDVDNLSIPGIKRVILCSGKVYYDLIQQHHERKIKDVAIFRIEQLYPFPSTELTKILKAYHKVKDIVWCQEEPQNQGAWYSVQHWLQECLSPNQVLSYIGRPSSASPATGYTALHVEQQTALVNAALNL